VFYNYARTDAASLTSSEKVADAILEKAGIEAVWVNCPLSQKEVQAYPSCDSEMGTADLVLRIFRVTWLQKLRLADDPLGFAQTCSETEPACELNVLYHQIEELGTHGYRADRIMGHAIAHEIAHVLIAPLTPKKESCAPNGPPRLPTHLLGANTGLHKRPIRADVGRGPETNDVACSASFDAREFNGSISPLSPDEIVRIFSAPPTVASQALRIQRNPTKTRRVP